MHRCYVFSSSLYALRIDGICQGRAYSVTAQNFLLCETRISFFVWKAELLKRNAMWFLKNFVIYL